MSARLGGKDTGCYTSVSMRVQAAMIAWSYCFYGILELLFAIWILTSYTASVEIAIKALGIAMGPPSALLSVASIFGVIATIRQSSRYARIWSTTFQIWFYLQLAFTIAIVALAYSRKLNGIMAECWSLSTYPHYQPTDSDYQNCERARSRVGLYLVLTGALKSVISYFMVRYISSFSHHCAEQTATSSGPLASSGMTVGQTKV